MKNNKSQYNSTIHTKFAESNTDSTKNTLDSVNPPPPHILQKIAKTNFGNYRAILQ